VWEESAPSGTFTFTDFGGNRHKVGGIRPQGMVSSNAYKARHIERCPKCGNEKDSPSCRDLHK
jgi:hypothetical protein